MHYSFRMALRPLFDPGDVASPEPPQTRTRRREDIPDRFKWNLTDIFPDWAEWESAYRTLDSGIERYAALKGTLAISKVSPRSSEKPAVARASRSSSANSSALRGRQTAAPAASGSHTPSTAIEPLGAR